MNVTDVRVRPPNAKNPLPEFTFTLRGGGKFKREVISATDAKAAMAALFAKYPDLAEVPQEPQE